MGVSLEGRGWTLADTDHFTMNAKQKAFDKWTRRMLYTTEHMTSGHYLDRAWESEWKACERALKRKHRNT